MAKSHGMTLDEAAGGGCNPSYEGGPTAFHRHRTEARNPGPATVRERLFANTFHLMDFHLQQTKARRNAALEAAYHRGLDRGDRRQLNSLAKPVRRRQNTRLPPETHARTLLRETGFSLREIARITGLDIYRVTSLKLQMRKTA